ncbi:ninja-family protein AFP1-like isoform X3 [Quercus lobata]|uniref:ninja-family protein AFP1-like isoform X3 n=1 Tax=Quercus lobata TaxID=97700 RepID=UPI001245BD1C|nr:ninja-family protein AFP1-like isoform X3 [Quercus lobata]XP_030953340.1 ninja-family protein AFP1-like isoform X3 [Quercus lobata]
MAQAENIGSREISRRIPMQMRNFPRDLLPRIMAGNHFHEKMEVEEGSEEDREEIELSLGLSLNGRFGVDPERAKKLMRSSSIPDFVKEEKETTCVVPMACAPTPLIRTCSLPTETEEQWRKRKELQSLRRLEAKRKRSEKQRNWKDKRVDNTNNNNNNSSNNSNDQKEKEQCVKVLNEFSWGCEKGNGLEGFSQQPIPLSQGSIGSQGSASSGISESESQPSQPQGNQLCGTFFPVSVCLVLLQLSYTSTVTNREIQLKLGLKSTLAYGGEDSIWSKAIGEFTQFPSQMDLSFL